MREELLKVNNKQFVIYLHKLEKIIENDGSNERKLNMLLNEKSLGRGAGAEVARAGASETHCGRAQPEAWTIG